MPFKTQREALAEAEAVEDALVDLIVDRDDLIIGPSALEAFVHEARPDLVKRIDALAAYFVREGDSPDADASWRMTCANAWGQAQAEEEEDDA